MKIVSVLRFSSCLIGAAVSFLIGGWKYAALFAVGSAVGSFSVDVK
jgi:hypothetical protein